MISLRSSISGSRGIRRGSGEPPVRSLIDFHKRSGALATLTAVSPPGRFGVLNADPKTSRVEAFREKSNKDVGYTNGGFFVLEPEVHD